MGSVQDVSLKEARLKRDNARQEMRAGVDIVQARRLAREVKAAEAATRQRSNNAAQNANIDEHRGAWSKKHADQWPSSLKTYAYPTIGHLRISEILPSHIFQLLKPIWVEKRETANRVRGRIETVNAKNVDIDDHDFRNPAELTKQLREKPPKRPKRNVPRSPLPCPMPRRRRSCRCWLAPRARLPSPCGF